ncbi:hypothetical protein DFA_06742 [Cavenderia fasciculata]|uniref:Uncharacterized protein n=1 Tax=Cavenderia fasciculata TaxID=261658 RepID=F4Q255_CACFS|nr:uncharacterized protein DFA_06742 [Cavenderia fasciculata]EGG18075.1 hypothetical protein DFA_06742 [Cavenderia fasciculata]|eukprot:XP_004366116.1 hypothetical protein DFA_06742 [Cavenderia fasciculata]
MKKNNEFVAIYLFLEISRLEMIDRITKRQNDIATYRDNLKNDTLSNYTPMVDTRPPVLVIIDIVRYAWEMDKMTDMSGFTTTHYKRKRGYKDERVRTLANDVSQPIDNIACAIKQPTNLTTQCIMLVGVALQPSIGVVILLQGITKLRLVDITSQYDQLFESVLCAMPNLDSLVFESTDGYADVYRPTLKQLSFNDGCHEYLSILKRHSQQP